ncbi:protein kinase domain-containing protein [Streptomyces sp. NRRL F-5727]|uniref:protein kinase domain-containing protein n=1 Tax=Streptomyces sp. NRRL F-5727 TaxID=1463871 RepID=UPI00099BB369|nr:ABC transporter substrate-binding protein [Streptomyces sp. NRRL F-5727]
MRGKLLEGRYLLAEQVGAGGMGVVRRARDERLGRTVAVKLLAVPEGTAEADRDRLFALFRREARAAAVLESSFIVTLYDHGTARDDETGQDIPYLVMPLLQGRTLAALLRAEGPLPPGTAARLGAQVCRALAVAHRGGVVHRDIKPGNVFLTDEGMVKVLDFGVATFVDATTHRLTRTGDGPIGTALYMAPERFREGPEDPRGDLYSLGCVLYELLTGRPPFTSGSVAALIHHHLHEPPVPVEERRPDLPPPLSELINGLLAKDPESRPHAEKAADRLEALASLPPASADAGAAAAPAAPATPTTTSYVIAPPVPPAPPATPDGTPAATPDGTPARGRLSRRGLLSAVAAVAAGGGGAAWGLIEALGRDDEGARGEGPGKGGASGAPGPAAYDIPRGTAADSRGPAPAPAEARQGGEVTVLGTLPPQYSPLTYAPLTPSVAQLRLLLFRALTGYRRTENGQLLVGDLATDPGRTEDAGLTWTFTLKEGVRYEDGSAVVAADLVRAHERVLRDEDGREETGRVNAFAALLEAVVENVEARDARTVVYRLRKADTGFPHLLAGPPGTPVPPGDARKGTKAAPRLACGPYRIEKSPEVDGDEAPVLARNPHWDAATDPIRRAFPDRYRFEIPEATDDELARQIASSPATRPAIALDEGVAASSSASPSPSGLRTERTGDGRLLVYVVNTRAVRDNAVRQALVQAFPRRDVITAHVRDAEADILVPQTRLLTPGIRGHRPDGTTGRTGAADNGDPQRARATLEAAGRTGYRLTIAYSETDTADQLRAEALAAGLDEAGFRATATERESAAFKGNGEVAGDATVHLFAAAVAPNSPDPSKSLRFLFDTRLPDGYRFGRFDDAALHEAIDRASRTEDSAAQARAWAAVDDLLADQGVVIPVARWEWHLPHGAGLEGVTKDALGLSLATAYVTTG